MRRKDQVPTLVLGLDLSIDEEMDTTKLTLVGKEKGKKVKTPYLKDWAEATWKEGPDLRFEVRISANGWFMFWFKSKEMASWVLENNWGFRQALNLFKRWHPLFDTQREKLAYLPICVKLPGLPQLLWTIKIFRDIGNVLGQFLEADMSFIQTCEQGTARIVVRLNPREGLSEEIQLHYQNYSII